MKKETKRNTNDILLKYHLRNIYKWSEVLCLEPTSAFYKLRNKNLISVQWNIAFAINIF